MTLSLDARTWTCSTLTTSDSITGHTTGAFSRKKEFIEFKLLFSFLKDSALPEKLPGGKWNCSVPHWPDFRQHMRCNMLRECEGGEDEVDCGLRV